LIPACSALRNLTRADIRRDPYPHIVVENCLAPEIYAELARTYPDDETILRLSGAREKYVIRQNHRYDLRAHRRILRHPGSVSTAWEEFVRHHVSPEFFREFLNLLGPEIAATYPGLETRLGRKMENWTTGIRFDREWDQGQIALDCQIGINTPAKRKSSARGVHTDAPDELFAMLLYFRRDDDHAQGGDLEICQWKKEAPHLFIDRDIDPSDTVSCGIVALPAQHAGDFHQLGHFASCGHAARADASQSTPGQHRRTRLPAGPGGAVRKASEERAEGSGGSIRHQDFRSLESPVCVIPGLRADAKPAT
jgi:hypothetical protein